MISRRTFLKFVSVITLVPYAGVGHVNRYRPAAAAGKVFETYDGTDGYDNGTYDG